MSPERKARHRKRPKSGLAPQKEETMEGLLFVVLFIVTMIFVVVVRTKLQRKIAPYEDKDFEDA